jgi:thioredoxin reductase
MLLEIRDDCVIAEDVKTGKKKEFPADTVLMATGLKPKKIEAEKFYHSALKPAFSWWATA